jgi:uncharacterized protein (DUF2344 family)
VPVSADIISRVNAVAPSGLSINQMSAVDVHAPALQTVIKTATYRIAFRDHLDSEHLKSQVEKLLALSSILRERRDKHYDLRPLINQLELVATSPPVLEMNLAASSIGGTARPDEVLEALGRDAASAIITRTAIGFQNDA